MLNDTAFFDEKRAARRGKAMRIAALLTAVMLLALTVTGSAACGGSEVTAKIVNGDFESADSSTGLPSGWKASVYTADAGSVGTAEDPSRGAVAHVTAADMNDARLCQTIAVAPDTSYTISCYVKTSGVTGGAGANIGIYGMAVTSAGVYGDTDWRPVELTGRTAPGQKELTVSVGVGGHGALSSGEAWFDSIVIEKATAAAASGTATVFGNDTAQKTNEASEGLNTFPTTGILQWSALATAVFVLIWALHVRFAKKPLKTSSKNSTAAVIIILLLALAVRIALALIINGHKTDINCFVFWGKRLAQNGAGEFYGKLVTENGVTNYVENWCDYPPGYMLVLGLMSKIGTWLKLPSTSDSLLVKLPCIIADLAAAYLVYVYAKPKMSRKAALALLALAAFTPVVAYISSAWGQIDQVLALLLAIPVLLLYDRKPVWAGIVYGAAIIIKPQALMAGPLLAAAYIIYVLKGSPYKNASLGRGTARLFRFNKDGVALRLTETVLAVIGALAVIVLVSLPFKGAQPWYWLINKYYGTATSYAYASVNAYNFWALIGANWKSTDIPFLGLTYGKWGTIFMALSVLLGIAVYVFAVLRHRTCKGALPLAMAFMFSGIFTFGHYMHERYIFPALLLLLFAYLFYNDRRILWTYVAYCTTVLVNCAAAFYYAELMDVYKIAYDRTVIFNDTLITVCSAANVLVFLWLAYVTFDLALRNRPLRGYNG